MKCNEVDILPGLMSWIARGPKSRHCGNCGPWPKASKASKASPSIPNHPRRPGIVEERAVSTYFNMFQACFHHVPVPVPLIPVSLARTEWINTTHLDDSRCIYLYLTFRMTKCLELSDLPEPSQNGFHYSLRFLPLHNSELT